MRTFAVCFVLLISVGIFCAGAQAQVNNLNEPGSILVYPLIDNINYSTIVEITNLEITDVWLAGFLILHPPGLPEEFEKTDFVIHLTHNEPFWWDTGTAYNRVDEDGVRTQIPAFNNQKGFMFVWAVDTDTTRLEIDWDHLIGDCLIFGGGLAFQYNPIPHQCLNVLPDRVLDLDGIEYTMATSQVMTQGFAGGFSGISGTFAVCSLEMDFIHSLQPEFDINFDVWNQDEIFSSRHRHMYQFHQFSLDDLDLDIGTVFTPKFQMTAMSTHALWCVFFENTANLEWGGNVFQHPDAGVATSVILPPIP